ncbi:dihydrodipicolinate synthase family protein [Proteus mirabilis]|uniref:dihydrodipicolinate synthase family protein n=1 Tax=Proteus mirabilis TaxID=584 RepID=UPI001A32BA54|nr:dihydrodipicolinate synthase family protein [Proteus mirabilis]MCL8616000.1 dihydrodipicolinate synthase family protein [Proteus mirabilis]MDC6034185.1 dihydrodipicolinate synthase family protein [Proteus mirabilis]MDC6048088.1 dihydrodipicolinate synthase family protein [Proteus mirabilis]MDC6055281.1 dihydrodipicolinate synthase family protein [Proteus mirabilis]MDC6065826.1 dihydrodipicolinate synthase family protein [Proteus mirabilis]
MSQQKYVGVWPVMLTPFDTKGEIDWVSLERLVDWYIDAGVHGLFAACQSSEMFYLSDEETQALTRFIVEKADGRVPVVASGHTATALSQQKEQLQAVASTGVDGVIMISNRLAQVGESDDKALETLQSLTHAVPKEIDLGIYECPYPYKRLLSEEIVEWCAQSNRFTFIKDTCCSLPLIERRLALSKGSRLHLANANSQTLLASFQAGCQAYSGVMANFHPELYVWLYENWQDKPEQAALLADYLSTAAMTETLDYPACAKYHQRLIGNFATLVCRSRNSSQFENSFFPSAVNSMTALGENMKKWLSLN